MKSKHLFDQTLDIFFKHVTDFTQNNLEYIFDSFCLQCTEQIIGEEGPEASEAEPASSGVGAVPSHGQEVLQDAFRGAEVSKLPGVLLGASQEAGASRIQAGAASLPAGTSPLEVLAACEAGLRGVAASEPSGESQEAPGAAEAWRPGAAQAAACSPRPPSCSAAAAPG